MQSKRRIEGNEKISIHHINKGCFYYYANDPFILGFTIHILSRTYLIKAIK